MRPDFRLSHFCISDGFSLFDCRAAGAGYPVADPGTGSGQPDPQPHTLSSGLAAGCCAAAYLGNERARLLADTAKRREHRRVGRQRWFGPGIDLLPNSARHQGKPMIRLALGN